LLFGLRQKATGWKLQRPRPPPNQLTGYWLHYYVRNSDALVHSVIRRRKFRASQGDQDQSGRATAIERLRVEVGRIDENHRGWRVRSWTRDGRRENKQAADISGGARREAPGKWRRLPSLIAAGEGSDKKKRGRSMSMQDVALCRRDGRSVRRVGAIVCAGELSVQLHVRRNMSSVLAGLDSFFRDCDPQTGSCMTQTTMPGTCLMRALT